MDNEITINGEVYVKKNSFHYQLERFNKLWNEDNSYSKTPNVKPYTDGEMIQIGEKTEGPIKEEKPWPQEGDEFWFIDYYGTVRNTKTWVSSVHEWKEKLIKFGNFFKTKEEAEMYALRIESLSKGLIFGIDQEGWIYNFQDECPLKTKALTIYPKFPTKEECKEWYNQYGSAWEALLEKKL